jgi:16S rRNA C1402 (ribose-2'-O) methylase RsmI
LADLSPRAREALATADVIAAEDTRHSAQLLRYLGLERPLVSLHEHNETARVPAPRLSPPARAEVDHLLARLGRRDPVAVL